MSWNLTKNNHTNHPRDGDSSDNSKLAEEEASSSTATSSLGKRSDAKPFPVQRGKEKCRKLVEDLYSRTEQFLQPGTTNFRDANGASSALGGNDDFLSSFDHNKQELHQRGHHDMTSLMEERVSKIMTTVKKYEDRLHAFKERVDSRISDTLVDNSTSEDSLSNSSSGHNSSNESQQSKENDHHGVAATSRQFYAPNGSPLTRTAPQRMMSVSFATESATLPDDGENDDAA